MASVTDWEWIEGAIECVQNFKQRDWWVFIVTNQSGIAFDLYTEANMQAVHDHMLTGFKTAQTAIDAIYSCPYHLDASNQAYRKNSIDRKPQPGMLLQAMAEFPVKRESSFLIGDNPTDIAAAHAAKIGGFLFTGGDLAEFAEWALASFEEGAR